MLGAVASNPDFSPGLIGLELVGPEEILGKAVDSWDKCDCQSVVTARKGGLSDDRVYPRGFAFTGHFFAPCGGGVFRSAGIERRRGIIAAGGGSQDQPAGTAGEVFYRRSRREPLHGLLC
jgi:hypothetical protein